MEFRPLTKDEIECRIGTCSDKGVSLLLYKDSRCDMRVLDETFGIMGWRNHYDTINGELFCTIEVFDDENGAWVGKQSNGSPSNMEAEKGRASDAFKRAGFMLGIGRELYTAPFIWVSADKCNIRQGRNGKPTCFDRFHVQKIIIEEGRIKAVAIVNDNTKKVCYVWQEGQQ